MPYCTIEEAWSNSLNPELKDKKYPGESKLGFKEINLEGSEIYGEDGKLSDVLKKKNLKRSDYLIYQERIID